MVNRMPGRPHRGFTLIELMAVMVIMALLLSVAAPRFVGTVDRGKEVVLKENLLAMRAAIDQYHADRQKYPDSLDELVALRYLRRAPIDPVTDSDRGWKVIAPAVAGAGAVFDIRSGAPGAASDGSRYADW